MKLFEKIPETLFSILVSSKKELYVQSLFVLREAFRLELQIRREDYTSMLMDSLEEDIKGADFTEEALEEGESMEEAAPVSGKAHLLVRRLRDTGWIEIEFDPYSFEEYISIPDYAISLMNLLYELSQDHSSEYNSYVYASYAALKNAHDTKEYLFHALQTAYDNTMRLTVNMKSLYNSMRHYFQLITQTMNPNEVLREHFEGYQKDVVDSFIYPLKTMDSIPRFRQSILNILQEWAYDDQIREAIVSQGIERQIFESEETGQERTDEMISFIIDAYRDIDFVSSQIDARHHRYFNAMTEHFRYLVNTDRGVKGNLVELLKHSGEEGISQRMGEALQIYRHQFLDEKSFFSKKNRTRRSEGTPQPLPPRQENQEVVADFLKSMKDFYTAEKIQGYVFSCMGEKDSVTTEACHIESSEEFILFFLAVIRGQEKAMQYSVRLPAGENVCLGSYSLPRVVFERKRRRS